MREKLVCLLIVVFFVFLAVFSYAHEDHDDFGDEIIILEKGRMPQVTFPHQMHQTVLENNCNACHDLFPKQHGIIKEMITQEKLKKQQVMNSNCLKCHKERKAAGQKAGPVKCTQCHVRSK
ncbi:MAG: cytochrome c3 family protein [Desulfobacteraceae bacterium]|nr:cytochrome c3 family protein [Desulfobacteraceae bacterium]MBC2756318.1 cytochrome c3 family protein [Desulfobacteraceae bacterium]